MYMTWYWLCVLYWPVWIKLHQPSIGPYTDAPERKTRRALKVKLLREDGNQTRVHEKKKGRENKTYTNLKHWKKLLSRAAEAQQASQSISTCSETLMIVKMTSSKPSHQVAEQAVIELLKRSADLSLQMVKLNTAANVWFVCLDLKKRDDSFSHCGDIIVGFTLWFNDYHHGYYCYGVIFCMIIHLDYI